MLTSYQRKAVYRDRENIFAFSKLHGIGQGKTFFFTLTFKDNCKFRKEAGARWNIMRTAIQKNYLDFRYILVAERQKRGSWHFHCLCFIPGLSSMRQFITFINGFCSVSRQKFGFCKCTWTHGENYKGVACYMTKYLKKSEEYREKGVRYVSYSRNWCRVVFLPFSWVGGSSEKWRRACSQFKLNFPRSFNMFYRNADYNRLTTVINHWQNNEQDQAIAGYFEFKHPLFQESLRHDMYDLKVFFHDKKRLLETKDDLSEYNRIRQVYYDAEIALQEFFSMKEHEYDIEEFAV